MIEPGIHKDILAAEYHAHKALSASGLKQFNRSPAHWRAMWESHKETEAMVFGSAYHLAILEPEKFDDEYIIKPAGMSFARKDGKAWKAKALLTGKIILSDKDGQKIGAMAHVLKKHETASALLAEIDPEVSVFWQMREWNKDGFPCKSRVDGVHKRLPLLVDLKTTMDANPITFTKQAINLQYHWQAAFYRLGWFSATREKRDFIFVCQEKEPPYAVGVYDFGSEPAQSLFYKATEEIQAALPEFAQCWKTDTWPAYPDKVMSLDPPEWALKLKD